MTSARTVLLTLFGVLTAFAVGCAGGNDDDSAPATGGSDEALSAAAAGGSGTLSQDLVCAAVKAADDASNDSTGLKSIPESKLQGNALTDFKSFQKTMLPDFPSQAFELPVKLGSKTFTFTVVLESNDGGNSVGIYKTDGTRVSNVLNSESEQGTWGAPADKCPDPQ